MSPSTMFRLANLLEEAATTLRSAAVVIKDLQSKIVDPTSVSIPDSLSVRARKTLYKLNITKLTDLEKVSGDQILECKNAGISTLMEIRGLLAMHGLSLLDDKSEPEADGRNLLGVQGKRSDTDGIG